MLRPGVIVLVLNLAFIISLFMLTDVSSTFYCTESFCEDHTSSYMFPCVESQNCTKIGFRTFLDPDVCNCCEYCFDYLNENDTCTVADHQKPEAMCGPHLKCVLENPESEHARCQKITSGPGNDDEPNYCMRKLYEFEQCSEMGSVGIAQMKPECEAGGNYAPRQCLPGSVCYCSNSAGARIFGLALPNEYQDCACARDISRLQEFGFRGKFPHCLPNGDYDELQCVVRTCYCRSHPETLVAMHNLHQLPCCMNNPKIHVFEPETPRYYVRDCELHRAKLEVKIADAELEGTKQIVADMPKCDPDGNYAPVQSDFNILYCAAPNGSRLGYEAEKFTAAAVQMNCYCARARDLLSNSATGKPACCSNGNYKPWQCIDSRCFCVDLLGRQDRSKGEYHKNEKDKLDCYPEIDSSNDGTDPECDYSYDHSTEFGNCLSE